MAKRNILVTGPPRCGKSTLIERVINRIERPATGFFTLEIRKKGQRVGFSINTVDGREGILAHQNIESRFRVGKYSVNLKDIEAIAVPSIMPTTRKQIVVIDEIGKMECFSRLFKETLIKVLDSPNWIIGSIAQKGALFFQGIKAREDVLLFTLTVQNRNMLLDQILDYLKPLSIAT